MLRTSLHPVVFAFIVGLGVLSAAEAANANATPQAAPATATQPAADGKAAGAKTAVSTATAGSTPAASAAPAAPPTAMAASAAPASDAKPSDANAHEEPKTMIWPFNGPTGYVDKQAAQRGFQVYKQICSNCHSMNLITYRSLSAIGFNEAEIKALAAEKQVEDYDDKGQRVDRPGKPFDHLVPPYPNEAASRTANGGAYPPDLSLIIKAREDGPNYVYSLLTGFRPAPANEEPVANKYYNPYFIGHWISMPPPLSDNAVTFQDGTPASVDQMAHDVVIYLQWAAEPEMEQRHRMGIKVLFFLFVMTGFLYAAKKRIWQKLKDK